jgi:Lipocalin-like domain
MDRRSILTIAAAAGLGLLPRSAIAQSKTLKEQIVGDWTLISWVQTRSDGSKNYRFGNNPKGINTFSPGGRFSLIIVQADLPKISSNDPMNPSAEEAAAIVLDRSRISGHAASMKRPRRSTCNSMARRLD